MTEKITKEEQAKCSTYQELVDLYCKKKRGAMMIKAYKWANHVWGARQRKGNINEKGK